MSSLHQDRRYLMRLELADFPVREVRFGKQTTYHGTTLEINKEELVSLILKDKKIATASLDVASPGEKTRIVRIRDVVEPRIKASGPGCVFPGIMGPVKTVGEGRTNRLSGVTVMPSAEYCPTILSGTAREKSGLVDMWGPAEVVTPFASTINIVPIFKLVDGVTELEAHATIQLAEFKVAHRVAETTKDQTPQSVEIIDISQINPSLPRIVYILGCVTQWHHPNDIAYYGLTIRESLPTLIHPNEFLDGALTTDARRGSGSVTQTWGWMNHPMVLRLLKEHGKSLNFLGIILQRSRWETELGKQASAANASQMARLLGADGAIVTRITGSGNNFVDAMLTVQACEEKGIKTVLTTPEWGGKDGTETPLVFYVPEATAMVSTGSHDRGFKLPVPTKVIGVANGQSVALAPDEPPVLPWDELTVQEHQITEGSDWWGGMNLSCLQY
jgi:glycine reductase